MSGKRLAKDKLIKGAKYGWLVDTVGDLKNISFNTTNIGELIYVIETKETYTIQEDLTFLKQVISSQTSGSGSDSQVVDLTNYYTKPEIDTELSVIQQSVINNSVAINETVNDISSITTTLDDIDDSLDSLSNDVKDNNEQLQAVTVLAKNSQKGIVFASYEELVSVLNSAEIDDFITGQSFYIVALNIPDLWIISKNSTKVEYNYSDEISFVDSLKDGLNIGFYTLSQLETTKVDLIEYVTLTDLSSEIDKTAKKAGVNTFTANNIFNGTNTFTGETTYKGVEIANKDDIQAGVSGEKGADGESAYQIAVRDGFNGTESEWLISLIGEKGEQGEKGEDGGTVLNHSLLTNRNDLEQHTISSITDLDDTLQVTSQSILNIAVSIGEVTTDIDDINEAIQTNNDDISQLQNNVYTKSQIDAKIATVYKVKGSITSFEALEALEDNTVGDVWNILSSGDNYVYDLEGNWDKLASNIDLTDYLTLTQFNTAQANQDNVILSNQARVEAIENSIIKLDADNNFTGNLKYKDVEVATIRDIDGLKEDLIITVTDSIQSALNSVPVSLNGFNVIIEIQAGEYEEDLIISNIENGNVILRIDGIVTVKSVTAERLKQFSIIEQDAFKDSNFTAFSLTPFSIGYGSNMNLFKINGKLKLDNIHTFYQGVDFLINDGGIECSSVNYVTDTDIVTTIDNSQNALNLFSCVTGHFEKIDGVDNVNGIVIGGASVIYCKDCNIDAQNSIVNKGGIIIEVGDSDV